MKSAVKSSTVESTASEASMKAAAVEAPSATAVETAAAKAASVTTTKAASVTTAATTVTATTATTAVSGRRGWLNQADSRQCEQAYNRFPHHTSSLGTTSLPRVKHFRTGVIRQSKSVRGKLMVSRG
jgi:hypothetical protein